jgi:MFS transporter, FLVCR family, MFS-domain-containing protein 7
MTPSPTKSTLTEVKPDDGGPRRIASIAQASVEAQQRLCKRRYYGLAVICLLNVVQPWAWLSYAMVNPYAQDWFGVGPQAINWFSTVYGLAFIPFPFSGWVISRYGVRNSIIIGSIGTAVGNWIRYVGTVKASFAGAMIGQTVLGLSQIFVLPVAPAYSGQWFHPDHRTTPTTLGSISPSLGAMIGSFATPYLATKTSEMPRSILIVAVVSTFVAFGGLFIPGKVSAPQTDGHQFQQSPEAPSPKDTLLMMLKSPEFYMVAVPFIVGLAIFNCWASLLLLYLMPYGFPPEDAGLLTGLQTGLGVAFACLVAPFIDKWRAHIPAVKIFTVMETALYIAFIFVPPSQNRGFAFAIVVLLGICGTTVLALSLEILAEILYPVPPEFSSTACWCIGNILGAVWIFGFTAGINEDGNPPGEMSRTLYAQAALAVVFLAIPINCLGLFGRKDKVLFRRREIDSLRRRRDSEA